MAGDHRRNTEPMLNAPRCGAKTRSGAPCQAPAVSGKARCRMHGGAAGSGKRVNVRNRSNDRNLAGLWLSHLSIALKPRKPNLAPSFCWRQPNAWAVSALQTGWRAQPTSPPRRLPANGALNGTHSYASRIRIGSLFGYEHMPNMETDFCDHMHRK
jgi:hypothetical protein